LIGIFLNQIEVLTAVDDATGNCVIPRYELSKGVILLYVNDHNKTTNDCSLIIQHNLQEDGEILLVWRRILKLQ
jgi:hypothetical protein